MKEFYDERMKVFLDDARWPGTFLRTADGAAAYALQHGYTVWAANYGALDDGAYDDDGEPLFTTLDLDDLDTLNGMRPGESSGWGPYRIEGTDPSADGGQS